MVNNSYLRKIERVLFLAILSIATLLTFGLPAAKAKAEANDLLLSDERYQAQIAVLREMTDNTFTAVSVKELRGTGGEPEFLVIEGSPGYAVYSEADDAVLEFSADALSPYDGLSGDNLYYFGDGAYYVLEDGKFLHLTTGQALLVADAEATLGVGLNDAVDTQSSDGYTYVTELTFTDVSISSFGSATSSPFYNMRSATEFGKNLYGSCAGVAANMLMQYYSDQYCPGFLPCSDADFDSLGWRGSKEVYYNEQTVNAYYEAGDSVAEKRHKYIYNRIASTKTSLDYFGAKPGHCYSGMQIVLQEANCSAYSVNLVGGAYSALQDQIKSSLIYQLNYRPVMGFIYTYKINSANTFDGKHSVIVYGSYTTGGKTYFLVNMGHENIDWGDVVNQEEYATIVPEEYMQNWFIYISPSAVSSHSYTATSTANGYHTMECSKCVYRGSAFTTTHPSEYTFGTDNHFTRCKYNYCNYSVTEAHTLSYRNKTAKLHLKSCSGCSYSTLESHLFIRNSSGKGVCVCGRVAGSGDPIINKKPEEIS